MCLKHELEASLTSMHFLKAALKKALPPSHVREDLEQLGLSKEKAAAVGSLVCQWVSNLILVHS